MVLKMEKYKIKVNNEAESKEVQELFFELGYYWSTGLDVKNLDARFLYVRGHIITMGYCSIDFSNVNYREITLAELRDLVAAHRKPTEQGLISGADAKLAWAKGEDVQYFCDEWTEITKEHDLAVFDRFDKYRIKPRTIKLELEIPAPFEPKEGEIYWFITDSECGYNWVENKEGCRVGIAAWRTEEEIKQVVEALRGALKNG